MTAVFPVAPSVAAAQTHQLSEAERNIVVQKQNAVLRADKGSGNPYKQAAVHSIQALRKSAVKPCEQSVMLRQGPVKDKVQAEILHRNQFAGVTCAA